MDFRYVDMDKGDVEGSAGGDNDITTTSTSNDNNTLLVDNTNRSTSIFSIKPDFITQW